MYNREVELSNLINSTKKIYYTHALKYLIRYIMRIIIGIKFYGFSILF